MIVARLRQLLPKRYRAEPRVHSGWSAEVDVATFHQEGEIAVTAGNGNGASGSGNWPDFGARLKRIYGNKVVADSEAVISYARGDW